MEQRAREAAEAAEKKFVKSAEYRKMRLQSPDDKEALKAMRVEATRKVRQEAYESALARLRKEHAAAKRRAARR